VKEFEFLAGAEVTILSDRRKRGPYGIGEGRPGAPGANWVERAGRRRAVPGKARFAVRAGDALVIETPGGGGHTG
jgi:N-methylhydantoinase B/oxoprolinase/acetone carboxylase alpha subunit